MNIVYSYNGSLPEYSINSVQQVRFFFNGPIYFIISDMSSPYVPILIRDHDVIVIDYKEVICEDFNKIYEIKNNKFTILHELKGREKLFVYTFERYFLLYKLMVKKNLSNILFMEVDNLIYNNPIKWLDSFCKKGVAYMYDNEYRCGAGICFIKDKDNLFKLNQFLIDYILYSNDPLLHEMKALHDFWVNHEDIVQLLPTFWPAEPIPKMITENFDNYNETLFDVAGMGIYLGGLDPHHTNGIIIKGSRGLWSLLDYTHNKFKWEEDNEGRLIPYILNNFENKWIKINNLHIHSKELKDCLSK
jgi:hypothetical protein